ncbi:MAG: hypothetical protein GY866_29810 [Proteobacteria bacterium]|nr:hypothetical protein [Pseudomonadota bacterium]
MKTKHPLLLFIVVLLMSHLQAEAQEIPESTSSDCAVSVDVWIIGESCIISGVEWTPKLETTSRILFSYPHDGEGWQYNLPKAYPLVGWFFGYSLSASLGDEDSFGWQGGHDSVIRISGWGVSSIYNFGLASKPTDFGWIEVKLFFDFSRPTRMEEYIDLNNDDDDDYFPTFGDDEEERKRYEFMTSLFSETQLAEFRGEYGDGIDNFDKAAFYSDSITQYLVFGFALKTPWPIFMQFELGLSVGYQYTFLDLSYCTPRSEPGGPPCGTPKRSFFRAENEYFGLFVNSSFALFEWEFNFPSYDMSVTAWKYTLIAPIRLLHLDTEDGRSILFSSDIVTFEVGSVSFHF